MVVDVEHLRYYAIRRFAHTRTSRPDAAAPLFFHKEAMMRRGQFLRF